MVNLRLPRLWVLVWVLGSTSGVAWPQTLTVDGVSGPWSRDAAPWAGFVLFDGAPLLAAAGALSVPAGTGTLHWDALTAQAYGVGWDISGAGWSNRLLFGLTAPTLWSGFWGTTRFAWSLTPGFVIGSVTRYGPWVIGAADVQVGGPIQILGGIDLGELQGGARVLFAGFPWGGVFVGEADATLGSSLTILGDSPVTASGSLEAQALGLWGHSSWTPGDWDLDVGVLVGMLWASAGSWQVTSQSVDVSLLPPSLTVVSSRSDFRLETDPAWGVLVRLAATWQPRGHLKATVSRWLGWTGGWRVQEGNTVVSAPAPAVTGSSSQSFSNTLENLLLAGTGLDITYVW